MATAAGARELLRPIFFPSLTTLTAYAMNGGVPQYHEAEFGMKHTTFTGASTTWMKALAIDSLGLPTKDESAELVKRLIDNVTSIEDVTGSCKLETGNVRKLMRARRVLAAPAGWEKCRHQIVEQGMGVDSGVSVGLLS